MSECLEFVAESTGCASSNQAKCCWCLFFTGLITLICCLAESFVGIEPTEYALVKHNFSETLTGDILEGGLQWVGLPYHVIRYPKIIQAIEFSDNNSTRKAPRLKTRTKEGLEISISCAIQYRLIKDELPNLYRNFEQDYDAKFIRFARSTILSSVSLWESFDFWQRRTVVGDDILRKLRIEFKKAGAYVVHFNMMRIDLPTEFNNAIIATQVMVQDFIKFSEVLEVEKIKRETENIKATANKNIAIIKSKAKKDATVILEQMKGELAAQTISGMDQQLRLIEKNLFNPADSPGVTNEQRMANIMEFYRLLRIDELKDDTTNKLFYNLGTGTTTLN